MPRETEKRIEELLKVLEKSGLDLLKTEDGKTARDVLKEINEEIKGLITVKEFERRLGGKQNFDDKGVFKGGAPKEYFLKDEIEQEKIDDVATKLENKWKAIEYKPLTAKILNDFLNAGEYKVNAFDESGKVTGSQDLKFAPDQEEDLDESEYWKKLDGFKIEDEPETEINGQKLTGKAILDLEAKLSIVDTGKYLLPLYYKKNNFNIDSPTFCNFKVKKGRGNAADEKYIDPNDTAGQLAIGTGVGKTTKTVNCLCRGGEQNIVLVCPTTPLVSSAAYHHANWLQKNQDTGEPYKCVVHGVAHGEYLSIANDLVYWKSGTKFAGSKGVSILEPGYLFGYLIRDLCKKDTFDITTYPELGNKWKEIKRKLIPEDTIIIFDEAHFGESPYQELIRQVIFLTKSDGTPKYRVLKMSATFPGVPFSTTSSFPIYSKYLSGFDGSKKDEKSGKTVDEILKENRTFIFLPNMKLKEKQKEILDKAGVYYIIFDGSWEAYAEAVSDGLPEGSIMIGTNIYEMGFTFNIRVAISIGTMELRTLGKGWRYDKAITQWNPKASTVQRRGRVGRKWDGWFFLTGKELREVEPTEDTATLIIRAAFTGDLSQIKERGIKLSLDFIRGAVSLPDKFGKYPEEILVGLGNMIVAGDKKANGDLVTVKTFENEPTISKPDKTLWAKHMGTWSPPELEIVKAKETLKLMISEFLKKQGNFPKQIKIEFASLLIKKVALEEIEVRSVLNVLIEKGIEMFANDSDRNKKFDRTKLKSKSEETIEGVAALYRLVSEVEISIAEVEDKKKSKKNEKVYKTVLKIEYPKVLAKERVLEVIGVWKCTKCLDINDGNKYCEKCGFSVDYKEEQDIQVAQILYDPSGK